MASAAELVFALDVSLARDRNGAESDEKIAFALQRSLLSLPRIGDDADRVTVDVVNGRVTLRGTTRFFSTRGDVEQMVERTPGVVSVTNELVVRP